MDSNSEHTPALPTSCALCMRILTSDNDTSDFEAVNMCSDCKFLLLEDLDSPMRDVYQWRSFGLRRSRYNSSSESIENLFPQQLSHMLNVARENQDNIFTSYRATPSGSRRWRRVVSDSESDGIDSVIAESESNVSFSGHYRVMHVENETMSYAGSSSASIDGEGSDVDTDTDIDPMHAGMYHWNSDDQEEDDSEWEEGVGSRRRRSLSLPESTWSRVGILSAESEDVEYLDGHELDEFAEHLAEADGLRRGAPPASISVVNSLPCVVIKDRDQLDSLVCAICKDSLVVGTVVNQLPCLHLYHPSCIFPWLSSRNTCPLCRYELPTDDQDYEDRKHVNEFISNEIQPHDMNEDHSSDVVAANPDDLICGGRDEREVDTSTNGGMVRGRWYFLAVAAAPVISVISVALMLWLGNPMTEPRTCRPPSNHPLHSQRVNNRGRRWWYPL
ncbi:unnamed protein product [Cuscuta epithymum]|uniref:RING-type E3 ubiquitin transferase n=1 Tax=Cuscuta epithymum TaxID=186058 RepID=A0AAV0ENL2_9ASTE|nr:unnamed protein product [Cuscuta epithymum]